MFYCNYEFEIKISVLDTRKHKHHLRHARNHQRGKLPKRYLKKTNFKKYLRSKQDPNVQSDEAKSDAKRGNFTVENTNDVNWIPYGDHRNVVEHGSGDIILLLEDDNGPNNEANQVIFIFCLYYLCTDCYII